MKDGTRMGRETTHLPYETMRNKTKWLVIMVYVYYYVFDVVTVQDLSIVGR